MCLAAWAAGADACGLVTETAVPLTGGCGTERSGSCCGWGTCRLGKVGGCRRPSLSHPHHVHVQEQPGLFPATPLCPGTPPLCAGALRPLLLPQRLGWQPHPASPCGRCLLCPQTSRPWASPTGCRSTWRDPGSVATAGVAMQDEQRSPSTLLQVPLSSAWCWTVAW